MSHFSIRAAINDGWNHFTRRPWYLFGLTIAVMGLALLVTGEAVAAALAYIILGGYLSLLLKHARHEKVVFDDLFSLDQRWISFAFGGLIKGLLVLLGLAFFIAPGVYLAIRWMFSGLYIIDQGMRPIEALKASYALTEGYGWKLFLYVVLISILLAMSLLFFFVGIFVAITVFNLSLIMLFWKLQEVQYKKSIGEL